MGLFSFGSKEDKRNKRVSRQGSASMASEDGGVRQDALLDPMLPEKQRARRRLIGALALIVAAVIVLPMILDSQPKPVPDDIAIQIPKNIFESCNESPQGEHSAAYSKRCEEMEHLAPSELKSLTHAPAAAKTNLSNLSHLSNKQDQQSAPATTQNSATRLPTKQQPLSTPAASDSGSSSLSSLGSSNNTKPFPRSAPATNAASSRFVIQLIAFSDEQHALSWLKRLKQANVPAYVERKKQNNRELWLVRAGPFNDRASAQAALKRIREAGFPLTNKAPPTVQQN